MIPLLMNQKAANLCPDPGTESQHLYLEYVRPPLVLSPRDGRVHGGKEDVVDVLPVVMVKRIVCGTVYG